MLSQSDDHQFAWAVSEQRAVVTFNFGDFSKLHEEYLANRKDHFGVIFSTAETVPVLLHRLLRLMNSLSGADLKNRVRWLNEYK